ncbi:M23 family metallopeptidase [Candidatus Ruminimicrobiellum ovillum]|uniref:M23 family metallopeptidase n=1 Tax=Candidatus Ruminimicrobiellum ovillum TaxID=1947927 RepID=UPI0035594BFC
MKKFYSYILLLFIAFFIGCTSDNMEIDITKMPDVETVVIQPGDVFGKTFEQTKLSKQESLKILAELKKYININKCKPNEFYEITYSTDTAIEETWTNFKFFPEGQYFYSIDKSTDNVITSEKLELQTTSQIFEVSGTIENSLWESMSASEIKPAIILDYADMFAWHIDFLTDCRPGDIYKLIYEVKTLEKKDTVLSSEIIAGQYITATSTNTAIRFVNSKGDEGYFDENGKSVKSAFLKAPLQFKRISSYFTKKRFHPILKRYRAHEGIDYAAPIGTPVSAVGDGVVTKSQYSGGYGNLVIIKHPNGYETYYGHLSKYGKGIKKGVRVKQGQVIGYVGSTGLSTGPHLDFRIKKNGSFVNYLTMKMPPTYTLTGKDKEDFDLHKQELINKFNQI